MPMGDGSGYKGRDSLGEFRVLLGAPTCRICGNRSTIAIRYLDKPKLNSYVADAPSLLIRGKTYARMFIRTIGINCGCYSKVHRQIAHIEDGQLPPNQGETHEEVEEESKAAHP